jgi:hypothetical protein
MREEGVSGSGVARAGWPRTWGVRPRMLVHPGWEPPTTPGVLPVPEVKPEGRGLAGSDHENMFDPKGMGAIPAAKTVSGPDFEGRKRAVSEWAFAPDSDFAVGARTGSNGAFNMCFEH